MGIRQLTGQRLFRFVLLGALLAVLAGCTAQRARPEASPTALPGGSTPAELGASPTPGSSGVPAAGNFPTVTPESPDPTPTHAAGRLASPPSSAATSFSDAPDRDLLQLAVELSHVTPPIPQVVNSEPVSYTQGRRDSFWLMDLARLRVYQRPFDLRLVSPRAYWYVEEGQSVRQADLERAAATFEEEIYPRVSAAFGQEWKPGVDNDPHLAIIHASLQGVGGYFSSPDEYPQSVYRYSNQREAIYINTSMPVGSPGYLGALAHELQHAIHWHGDPTEATWVNEGLSELAVTVAGYRPESISRYLQSPTVSLTHWPLDQLGANVSANYGAASLFFHYLSDHYGDRKNLTRLVAEPANGIDGIDAYLKALGYKVAFNDVFRDWVVANILDEAQGVYGYNQELDVHARVVNSIDRFSEVRQVKSQIPQYAVEYTELTSFKEALRVSFRGQAENSVIPADAGDHGCWWSNAGDSINSTLTRAIDLTGLQVATLNYEVWYRTEEAWDYAYVEVSSDGGKTWEILATPHTSSENPIGNSFGPGYTGTSSGWITESIDLNRYAGSKILLRFQYVTDDAVDGPGLCFRNITVRPAGLTDGDADWQANGFVRINNRVRQQYIVQIIRVGQENKVTVMPLDDVNFGETVIPDPEHLNRLVVAVAALAPKTQQPASYTLTVKPAG